MKVLIPFYSLYGHVYQMALAVAEGVAQVEGAEAVIRRVPETLPAEEGFRKPFLLRLLKRWEQLRPKNL